MAPRAQSPRALLTQQEAELRRALLTAECAEVPLLEAMLLAVLSEAALFEHPEPARAA